MKIAFTLASIAAAMLPALAHGGPNVTFAEKAMCADAAVELEVRFDAPLSPRQAKKATTPDAFAYPPALWRRALRKAGIVATLFGRPPAKPQRLERINLWHTDGWAAHERGRVRVLAFLVEHAERGWEGLAGVEGHPHDGPTRREHAYAYVDAVAATRALATWKAEDAARKTPRRSWREHEAILRTSDNPALQELTVAYLCAHDRGAVVDRALSTDDATVKRALPYLSPGACKRANWRGRCSYYTGK